MTVRASATIENDVNFTLIQTGSNTQNESASLNYSVSLTDGSGSLNINYGVMASGVLPSGGKTYLDFRALDKEVFDNTSTITFNKIKALVIENEESTYSYDINIHATGTNACTGLFNGGSGNLLIKPQAVYQYADPISGLDISGGDGIITLEDVSGSGAAWRMVIVGIT